MVPRMRIPFLCVLVAAMLLVIGPPAPAQAAPPQQVPGELIIRYKAGTHASDRASLRGQMRADLKRDFKFLDLEHVKLRDMTTDEAIAKFQRNPHVQYVEPNYVLTADVIPNDTRFGELYGMRNTGQTGGTAGADIKAYLAWDQFTGDPNLKIGIIDTGVDYNHPDLAANIWTNPGEIPGNGLDDDGNGYVDDVHGYDFYNNDGDPFDDNGHGSHCAGTIAGVGNNNLGVAGVCWSGRIVAMKFLSAGGSGSTDGAIRAIQYAIVVGVRLTSNSWGGGSFSQALLDAINAAGAANQLFVAAAGNSGSNNDTSPHYPSSYDSPYIVAVAATDHNDNLASFSCYGATSVDLAAPGVDILSCQPGGGYQLLSGTSMATPHVSGAVALAMGRFPAMTSLQIKQLLMIAADPKAQLAGKMVTGGRLNAFMTIAEPDETPPGAIADLATADPSSNAMGLTWTATGDDGATGRATSYEIRYSTAPIDETSWPGATLVPGPDPLAAGSPQSFEVRGLAFNTTYWFAIKAFDEFNNAGPLSNVASGTTLGIPDIAYAPASFSASLLSGGVEVQTLTLSNAGEGTLDFAVPTPELQFAQPVVYQPEDVPKEGDIRIGQPVLDNQGGPDGYGYRWIDSNEPGGPAFDWVDITALGTPVSLTGDDATSAAIPMGMDFPFYGGSFNSVRVCTNGWLSFTDGSTAYGNQALPNAGAPANLLAPLWDDLNFGSTQRAYTHFDGARFIVSWVDVPHYSTGGPYTFQVILHPTGEIRYQYLSVAEPTNSLTVGLQNATKDIGLTVAHNTAYLENGLAIRVYPLSQWLTVTPTAGRILAGASQDLQVRFNALGMMGGTYEGTVGVLSNDPDESPLALPATLHVTGAPDLAVSPEALDFGTPFAGATVARTLTVSNPGTDDLVISDVTSPDPTVTVDVTSFTLVARAARNLTVTWHSTAPMVLGGALQIASNDPDSPVKAVPLTGEALIAPSFSVTPEALAVTLLTNTATSRTLRVANSGGSNYVFTAEAMALTPSGTVVQHGDADNVELEKGAPDVQFGPEPDRAGGPDTFGYTYADSDEPDGPAFEWVDIRSVGTQIPMTGDDVNTGPYPIGFSFPFYGNMFTSFRICTNGFISFTSTKTALSNTSLPNSGTSVPENLLALFWDDLNFQTYQRAWYHYDGTRLVIQYQDVAKYGDYTHPNTFEAILYPNGTIVYQYLSMTATTKNSATIGIQDATKTDGLQVVYNANYVKDNLAIRFRPPARFLTVSPEAGTVPPGGYVDLNVGFNATGLFGGLYEGVVRIAGNDPVLPQRDVPADLTVIGVPDIAVAPPSLAYGDVFIGYPRIQQVTVRNLGTDVLHVTDVTSSDPAYGANPLSFEVPALGTAVLNVSFNPPSVGAFPATLSIASDDPDTPVATVELDGAGIVAPDVAVDPAALAVTLNIPASETRTVTVHNTGGSDLTFSIGTVIGAASVPVYEYVDADPGKDEADPRPGVLGSGGPDVFGYTWRDSDEPGGPVFDWVDITGTGTLLAFSGDDQNVTGVPIGFDFPFYGGTFNTVNVCSNGWLSFTSTLTSLTNYALPSGSAPPNLLAAFWDDLDMRPASGTGRAYVFRDGTRFILSYVTVPRYSTHESYTFQVVLYPSGRIVYQYLSMQTGRLDEATIGIQNGTRDDGLTVVYNADYVHDGLAVEIATVPDYLTVTPTTGTIPAGGSQDLAVNFNTAGMFGGVYAGAVRVQSNDPDEAVVTVPTTLTAIGTPDIAAVPASLDFGWQYVGLSRDLTVQVRNVGSDVLTVASAAIADPDFSLVGGTFPIVLGSRGTADLTVRFAPTGPCDPCAGSLVLTSDDPDSPEFAVPLTGIGVIPPEIGVDPPSLRAALATTLGPTALTTGKQLVICNTGGSDLTWTAEALSQLPASVLAEMTEVEKDDPGSPGPPAIAGHGGPDAYGYRWVDSDDPMGPAFAWEDISGVGVPIPLNADDQNLGPFPIPFPFPYYGNSFSSFRISSNGWVSFTNTTSALSNYALPSASAPENLLAVWWDDQDFRPASGSARAFYHYDGTKLIISFLDVPRYSSGGPYTYQVLLYPSGTIDFQYLDMQGDRLDEATIGIQNATRDVGLTVAYNAAYVKDHLRVRFSNRPGWLTVSPVAGVTPAGECDTLTVGFSASGLADGDYEGLVRIASNDLDEPQTIVPCSLHVGVATAAFDLAPNTLNRSSNGNWVQGKLTPPAGWAPEDIVTSSVLLVRTVPVVVDAPISYDETMAYYKFDRTALMVLLPTGDEVPVEVIGRVDDATWFRAVDVVRVLKPAMAVTGPLAGYGEGGEDAPGLQSGATIQLRWADPEGHTATSYQLWYSENAGESWTLVADGLTQREYAWTVPVLPTDRGMLDLAGLDEIGVMGSWLSEVFTVSGGATATDEPLPTQVGLSFVGPNPAAQPRLELALPTATTVRVRVHDVRGALVRELAAGEFEAGRHRLQWDGTGAAGQAVHPGMYFVRAEAGGRAMTLRVVLVR